MSGYHLYILRSQKDNRLYIGVSKNVAERLRQHNDGLTPSTRYRRPFTLVHTEHYADKKEALAREKYLKSLEGSTEKRRILELYDSKRL